MTRRYFAGIGSRSTPTLGLRFLRAHSASLIEQGLVLRSGGALGADTACYLPITESSEAEIFLATRRECSPVYDRHKIFFDDMPREIQSQCMDLAKFYHPNWKACGPIARKLHARNILIVLGRNLRTPVEVVICFTEGAELVGGTRTALVLAKDNNIPIINFGTKIQSWTI